MSSRYASFLCSLVLVGAAVLVPTNGFAEQQTMELAIPSDVVITINETLVIVNDRPSFTVPVPCAVGTPHPHNATIVDPGGGIADQQSRVVIYRPVAEPPVLEGTRIRITGGGANCTADLKLYSGTVGETAAPAVRFFIASDGVTGAELWKTDGTEAGTALVKDINPGSNGSFPYALTIFNGALYFRANDGTIGEELWRSDGTEAGTTLVKDINPGANSSSPRGFAVFNGTLYFTADDGTIGNELWRSDGTEAGTALVKDINPGLYGSFAYGFTVFKSEIDHVLATDGAFYFGANDGINGTELWRSDGTEAGTVLVKDISPRRTTCPEPCGSFPFDSSFPSSFIVFNDALYFRAIDGTTGGELWRSDGTVLGTVLVKDICAGGCGSAISGLTVFNGALYFSAQDVNGNGIDLWRSDGTATGTARVKDISPEAGSGASSNLTVFNSALYFTAADGTNGSELWRSDGTEAGTALFKDINPGANGSFPIDFTVFNGALYFHAIDGTNGRELWRSDGTAAGTVLFKDINPGANWTTALFGFTVSNGALSFFANDGTSGRELWRSDGTAAGTVLVKDICPGPCDGIHGSGLEPPPTVP